MSLKNNYPLQIRYFEKIRDVLPSSVSLVNEVADLLNVSTDSAYRRMRGETPLSVDEALTLSAHFQVNFDFNVQETSNVTFNYNSLGGSEGFKQYLQDILFDLQQLAKVDDSELFYTAVDVPIVHNFKYPALSAFKIFYWLKAVLNETMYDTAKFSRHIINDELKHLGEAIYKAYSKINSTEIWNSTTVNGTLSQIEFYWDAGLFETKADALLVCEDFEKQLKNIEKQAEKNSKNIEEPESTNNFKLYISDIEIGNNSILTRKGNITTAYLSFHTFNKLVTMNPAYCEATQNWINNMIRKSTLISGVSEKQRYKFFKVIYDKIEKLKNKIETE
jgi:hypothetical protein